jgi:class 3 adenylate cyclase
MAPPTEMGLTLVVNLVLRTPQLQLQSCFQSTFGDGENPNETSSDNHLTPRLIPYRCLSHSCTVLFADVVGFTAWSSIRDPAQVFLLLETIYGAFDAIARKRGVFKVRTLSWAEHDKALYFTSHLRKQVETIGDSYVAVCGLPEPREDHAIVMCRFARDCRQKMNELTRGLETTLGPDTGDLKVRQLVVLGSGSPMGISSSHFIRSFDSA